MHIYIYMCECMRVCMCLNVFVHMCLYVRIFLRCCKSVHCNIILDNVLWWWRPRFALLQRPSLKSLGPARLRPWLEFLMRFAHPAHASGTKHGHHGPSRCKSAMISWYWLLLPSRCKNMSVIMLTWDCELWFMILCSETLLWVQSNFWCGFWGHWQARHSFSVNNCIVWYSVLGFMH